MQGHPDSASFTRLSQALVGGDSSARERVVAELVEVGLQLDPNRAEGTAALRDTSIVEILVTAGLARCDLAREATMEALRKFARAVDLARWGDSFAQALEQKPTKDALLLVAKAKAMSAEPFVHRLAQSEIWRQENSLNIAQASLGDHFFEDQFVRRAADAHAAKNAEEFMDSLLPLAMIGTRTSLTAVAQYLRTPLTYMIPMALERSCRLSVLEALAYYYPDRPELYSNNITKESHYAAAERFCGKELGVTFDTPPPRFMTYRRICMGRNP